MIAQQLLNGLVSGSVYALFALGFTLVFGTHRILNLAYSSVFMAGAFLGYYAVQAGAPFWLATLLAMAGAGLLSWLIDVVAFRRLRATGQLEFGAVISSIGASLVVTSLAQKVSSTQVLSFPFGTVPVQFYRWMGLRVSLLQLTIVALVFVILLALAAYLYRTSYGRQVRAVSGNERASVLLGISPNAVYFQTFFVSGALAGLAGVLIGLQFNSIHFLMGEPYMLRAFVIVVLGGLGSVQGAVLGGLLLGVLQTLATAYLPSGLVDTIVYSLLFVTLLVRPSGLFGTVSAASGFEKR